MREFCDVDLTNFKTALEFDGLFSDLQSENDKLYKILLEKFLHAKLVPPFIQDYALLNEHLNHYLFLARIHTIADKINICKPNKFTIKMPTADLCPEHQLDYNLRCDLIFNEATWHDCNHCYIQHSKNKANKEALLCLNSISALPSPSRYLGYLDYTLAMRVVYSVKILILLEFYNKHDHGLAVIYSLAKELLANSLQSLTRIMQDTDKLIQSEISTNFIAHIGQKISASLTRGINRTI